MSGEVSGKRFPDDDAVVIDFVFAVHGGDVATVERLLEADSELATARFVGKRGSSAPLHVVADWPGYFPQGPQIARVLLDAGADPNAWTTSGGSLTPGPGSETPLQWAASSDDVDVAEVLIDGGADIEAGFGSIGTPLSNAIGYCCWHVARLLVARGARVDSAWHASALGLLDRLESLVRGGLTEEEVSQAFWHACAGGQRRAAEYLLSVGADLNWEPEYASGTPLEAARGPSTREENVITWLEELGARSTDPDAEASGS
jgi:hypothetical protein